MKYFYEIICTCIIKASFPGVEEKWKAKLDEYEYNNVCDASKTDQDIETRQENGDVCVKDISDISESNMFLPGRTS
jgi:hypothetical protein